MPTTVKPPCGPCGPQWYIHKIEHKTGSIYTVIFHGLNVTRILYDIVRDCEKILSGYEDPTSSEIEIDLLDLEDGKAFFVPSCPNCTGFCQPFEFEISHNGTLTPAVPALRAVISGNNVLVFWDFEGGVDAFELQVSRDGEAWTDVTVGMSANIRQLKTGPWVDVEELAFRMRARKGATYSEWSEIVTPSVGATQPDVVTPSPGNVPFSTVRTDMINIVQDPDTGLFYDAVSPTSGDYNAFYYINGRPLKSPTGEKLNFQNMSFESGFVDVEKIYLHKDHYPNWQEWELFFWKTKEIVSGNYVNDWWVLASSQQRLVIP